MLDYIVPNYQKLLQRIVDDPTVLEKHMDTEEFRGLKDNYYSFKCFEQSLKKLCEGSKPAVLTPRFAPDSLLPQQLLHNLTII